MRLVRSAIRRSSSCFGHVESDDEGRMPPGAAEQLVPAGRERAAGLGELERADDATAVVRMNARRGRRVELTEASVSGRRRRPRRRAPPSVHARPPSEQAAARARPAPRGSRAPCPPDDERRPAWARISSIAACASGAYSPTEARCAQRPDPDQPLRVRRAVREDRQPVVDLHRIGGDDLRRHQARSGQPRRPTYRSPSARRGR